MMKRWIAFCLCSLFCFSLWGCSPEEKASVTPAQLLESMVKEIGQDNMPMMADGDDGLLESLYGLSPEDVEAYAWTFSAVNVRADEYFIAQVKEGKMDTVKEAIDRRQKDLEETWKRYLPEVYDTVKDFRIVEKGDFIFYVVSSDADKAVAVFEEAF